MINKYRFLYYFNLLLFITILSSIHLFFVFILFILVILRILLI